ncbi:MAG: DUF5683 domain-containing protein [Bacteroidetes bacterium]|nr:DUF5683 domain-containing protein [Bacteroidota bacterium]
MAHPTLTTSTLVGLSLLLVIPSSAHGQLDTMMTDPVLVHPDPNTALRRALVPGWGQLYNREYYKVPIVYVGIAAFSGSALLVNRRYLLYRHAYLYTARTNEDGMPVFPHYAGDYAKLIRDLGLNPESSLMPEEIEARRARLEPQFRTNRDSLRRNRDLLYFGTIAWYGLTILDAYVSAHLAEFDVDESLTIQIVGGPEKLGLSITW